MEIDAVGGQQVTPDGVLGQLSNRQREAIRGAIEVEFYDVPVTVRSRLSPTGWGVPPRRQPNTSTGQSRT